MQTYYDVLANHHVHCLAEQFKLAEHKCSAEHTLGNAIIDKLCNPIMH